MKIIAVTGSKGGAGRTMLAVQLAVAAQAAGRKTAVLTTSMHGASLDWGAGREGGPDAFHLAGHTATALARISHAGYGIAVVDMDGGIIQHQHAAGVTGVADTVLIPFRPALPDIRALLADAANLPDGVNVLAVCNAARAGTSEAKEALEFLAEASTLKFARTVICDRVLFRRTFAAGKGVADIGSKSKAKEEILSLYEELKL
jgi:chromosome partitioning protein